MAENQELSGRSKLIIIASLILAAGGCGVWYFCSAFQAGEGGVANIGLLFDRLNGVLVSLAVAFAGLLIILFATLRPKP
jgi:hypothetical protein